VFKAVKNLFRNNSDVSPTSAGKFSGLNPGPGSEGDAVEVPTEVLENAYVDPRILRLNEIAKNWDSGSQEEVIKYLSYDDEPFLQAEALGVLGKFGDETSAEKIMTLTGSEEVVLQRAAVSALGGISTRILRPEGRTLIVRKLIEVYRREKSLDDAKNDGNAMVVLEKIGKIFHPENTAFLLAELETETNINTKYVLVNALSTHMTKEVVSALDTVKQKSEDYLRENLDAADADEYQEFIALVVTTRLAIASNKLLR
jgi:hypothetical protein